MLLLVVRHAHAGSRDRWRGDDALRPLTERGVAEASAVAELLAPYRPVLIVSSPLVRCVQTVQPLATRMGGTVETSAELGPSAGERAAAYARELAKGRGPVVVCTHGETIEALQEHLEGPGATWRFEPGAAHEKGSVWVLTARRGRLVSAEYLPPARPRGGVLARTSSER